jgi:hypothetical protein
MNQSERPNPTEPLENLDLPDLPEAGPTHQETPIEPPLPDDWDDVAAVREVVLAAYRDCVPELVRGSTVKEVLNSVTPAREAFARLVEELAARQPAQPVDIPKPPVVPAGGAALVIDPDLLPPTEKLRRAIAAR